MIFSAAQGQGQEVGLNFNHNAEILDLHYADQTGADWIRTTPRVMDYAEGKLDVEDDPALDRVVEAAERGYKVAFGFRWDFANRKKRIPAPGSAYESELFETARHLLERAAPYSPYIKLGNEPALETLDEDKRPGPDDKIPLLVFYDRVLTEVVQTFYREHPEIAKPKVFVGSLVWLWDKTEQADPSVTGMLRYAQENPSIDGVAIHLHIDAVENIEQAFRFLRSHVPKKPVIVPEFSLQRLYRAHNLETLGSTRAGLEAARRYGRDPKTMLHEWYSLANSHRVSPEEWLAVIESRDWYPRNYLRTFYESFRRHGVTLATYPLLQQYAPSEVPPDGFAWFLNPVFCQVSLTRQPNGDHGKNPLCFEDFLEIVREGRGRTGIQGRN